jgi:GNAT superfamily N-acetyltransferase
MAAEIRAATEGEGRALLPAYEWLFAPPGAQPPSWEPEHATAALESAIAGEGSAVFVAEEDGELAGICTAYLDIDSVRYGLRCWVEDLAVRPALRSRGTGGLLLDAASAWARERGATHLELDTALARADAQRFYDRREPAGKGYSYSWEL